MTCYTSIPKMIFISLALTYRLLICIDRIRMETKESTIAEKKVLTNTQCYHCGDLCDENNTIIYDEKPFCCNGCQAVYQILEENELTNYYDIEPTPGIKKDFSENEEKYAYLDHEETLRKLVRFDDGQVRKITLHLPDIHCHSCVYLLENIHRLHSGILSSRIQYLQKTAIITYDISTIKLSEVAQLLHRIGYPADFRLEDLEKKTTSSEKQLYLKLGVAGFSFGNVMLMVLPEYLPGGELFRESYGQYFGILSMLLSLPVLLFSARDYFISSWLAIRQSSINMDIPITLGIIAVFSISSYEVITNTGSGFFDSFTGLIFFLLIGKIFQQKTFHYLNFERNYKSYFPLAVTRKSSHNTKEKIALDQVQTGDTLYIRHQEIIPADAVLSNDVAEIDYSFVTGESHPVKKYTGDTLYAGGRVAGKAIHIKTTNTVSQSYLTSLWNHQEFSKPKHSSLQALSNVVSKYFTIVVLIIAFSSFGYWYATDSMALALRSFTSVLIIACPCALALSIPFAYGNMLRIFGRAKLYLKSVDIIDQLAQVKGIIFDKTGTITDSKQGDFTYHGPQLTPEEEALIRSTATQSHHPLSRRMASELTGTIMEPDNVNEEKGKGVTATFKNIVVTIGAPGLCQIKDSESTRTGSKIYFNINGKKGYFDLGNYYRPGVHDMIHRLDKRYETVLLSGDNESEGKRLSSIFGDKLSLHFNQRPEDKLTFVKNKEQQYPTAMLGDGLNDAGALKSSTAGIAVTDDIASFTPSSDAILQSDKLQQLDDFFTGARRTRRIVYGAFGISFSYNIIGLFFATQGLLSPIIAAILMPVSSVTVVLYAIFATEWAGKKLNSTK